MEVEGVMNTKGMVICRKFGLSLTRVCLLALLATLWTTGFAQNTFSERYTSPGLAPGAPLGSDPLSSFEQLNYFNGNLSFSVPLLAAGGRGGAGHSINLTIEHHWKVVKFVTPPPQMVTIRQPQTPLYQPLGYSPGYMETVTVLPPPTSCGQGNTNYLSLIKLVFTAANGTRYEMRDLQTDGQTLTSNCFSGPASRGRLFATRDGSSATYISDQVVFDHPNPFINGFLMMRDGMRYRIENARVVSIRDRNGNQMSFNYDGSSRLATMTDPLNRVVTISYDVQDVAPFGLCDHIVYKGFGGATRVIRISKTNLGSVLRTTQPGDHTEPQSCQTLFPELFPGPGTCDRTVVSSAWLPDGRRYQFFYNVYSDLARVVLPTGGAVEYDWGASHGAESGSGALWDAIFRRVVRRRVYANGSTLTGQTHIERPTDNGTFSGENIGSVDVKEQTGDGSFVSHETHYFFGSPTFQGMTDPQGVYDHYPRWKDGREYKTEFLAADGTTLRRVEHTWLQSFLSWWPFGQDIAPPNNPFVSETTTTLVDAGLVSKQIFAYDAFNNLTDALDYGFGAGAPGTLLRHTHTDHAGPANPINGLDYTVPDIHLRNLPTLQQIFDSGGILRAQTAYEYDNYNQASSDVFHASLTPRPNISGFDSSFSTSYYKRGNPTKITRYLLDVNGNIAASFTNHTHYDIAGNVVKTIDPRSTTTNIIATSSGFDDSFGSPDMESQSNTTPSELGALQSYAFPTQVTNALGHISYTQFDYYLGAPVNIEDANGIVSSTEYGNAGLDLLDRPSRSVRAINILSAKSQTKILYNDVDRIVTATADQISFGDNVLKSETVSDGLGRVTETRVYEASAAFISTKREYDSIGRVKRSYNPHRTTGDSTYGWTDTTYDSLSRVVKVEQFDLNGLSLGILTTDYSGQMTMLTDQAGKRKVSRTNALGQITDVWEITPADSATVAVSFSALSLNGYLTHYDYDALNNLTKVTQGSQPQRLLVYNSLGQLASATQPDSGTTSYQYDGYGNLAQRTAERGPAVTTTYAYDAINRPTNRTYSDGTPAVTYGYDSPEVTNSKGRLTSVSSSVSSSIYSAYDPFGRVLGDTQTIDGAAYSMNYSYNLAGEIISQKYPSGRVVNSEYDSAGRLAGVKNQANGLFYAGAAFTDTVNRIQYSPAGIVSQVKLGNGLWEHTNFNSRLQVTQIGLGSASSNSSILQLDYSYGTTNNNGNVLSQTINIPTIGSATGFTAIQTYGYDSLNRLASAQENSGVSWTQNFSYDRFGNRKFIAGTTLPTSLTPANNPTISLTNNRIDNSVVGQASVLYDNIGNLTREVGGHTYGYDGENRMVTYDGGASAGGGASYNYDANGRRVKKVVGGSPLATTVFIHNIMGELVAEYTDDSSSGNGTSYLTRDQLGTPRVITGANQQIKARHDYLPFGEEISQPHGGRTPTQGYVADNVRQKFTAYQHDNETGLDFAQARYYANIQGRFTSSDPLLTSGKPGIPQSWNRFTYVLNNPLKFIDPSGTIWVYHYLDKARTKIGVSWIDADTVPKSLAAQGYKPLDFGGQKTRDITLTDGSVARLSPNSGRPEWLRGAQESGGGENKAYVNTGLVREIGRRTAPMPQATAMFVVISITGGYTVTAALGLSLPNAVGYGIYAAHKMNEDQDSTEMMGNVTQYKDITQGGSLRNVQTDISKADFIKNLTESGYKMTQSGNATILDNGVNRYAVYDVATSTGGPSAAFSKGAGETLKIRLKP